MKEDDEISIDISRLNAKKRPTQEFHDDDHSHLDKSTRNENPQKGKEVFTRISITIPQSQLKKFDDILENVGYNNRSEAIREAIRLFCLQKSRQHELEGYLIGTLALIYNHHNKELLFEKTDLEHIYDYLILSSMHIHIDVNYCLELIAIHGNDKEIKEFISKLLKIPKIETVEFIPLLKVPEHNKKEHHH